jgi:hypothetical protein
MKRQTHALARGRLMQQEVPLVYQEVSRVRTTTWGGFAPERIVLNSAPTTLNQRVAPSRARRVHSDRHLTVWPRTQTMHGNGVPVDKEAVREFV